MTMSITAREKMPEGAFGIMRDTGPGSVSTEELFSGKKVVLVSVPGAFTPTCSMSWVRQSGANRFSLLVSIELRSNF